MYFKAQIFLFALVFQYFTCINAYKYNSAETDTQLSQHHSSELKDDHENQHSQSRLLQIIPAGDMSGNPGGQMMNNNASAVIDYLNSFSMMLSSIPMIKLGMFGTFLTLLIPTLHVVLILSLIAFSLAGTITLICATVDCHGLNPYYWSRSYSTSYPSSRPFQAGSYNGLLKKSFKNPSAVSANLWNNNGNLQHHNLNNVVPSKSQQPQQYPWNVQILDNSSNLLQQSLDEYEKLNTDP